VKSRPSAERVESYRSVLLEPSPGTAGLRDDGSAFRGYRLHREWASVSEGLPVVWICGAPGVGKSTVAWEMVRQLRADGIRTAYADIDQLGICYPEPADDPVRNRLKARNLGAVADNFRAEGAACLLVSGVLEKEHLPMYRHEAPTASILVALLQLDPVALRERLVGRGADEVLTEATILYSKALERGPFADLIVETTGKQIAEVARLVRDHVWDWPSGSGESEPAPIRRRTASADAGDSPGPVLWVCGATAVGKSAVAWQVFQQALAAGVMAAFVDLAQVGKLSLAGDPENHRLRARNLADIWSNCRESGARFLVVTGAVSQREVLADYARLLPPGTTLTVCRLTASAETLTTRVELRARGVGWPEPGDRLQGLSSAEVGQVVEAAVAEDHHLERLQLGDLRIETDLLTIEEAAQKVLAGARGWREPLELSGQRSRR
jgi:adenylylsulfate kinase-like enzyme